MEEESEYKYRLARSSLFRKDMKTLSVEEKQETKEVIKKLANCSKNRSH